MKKKILILLFALIYTQAQSIEIKIIHNIQNEIITNIDIKNEFKYLLALNNSLKELDKEKILTTFFSFIFILKPFCQVKTSQEA